MSKQSPNLSPGRICEPGECAFCVHHKIFWVYVSDFKIYTRFIFFTFTIFDKRYRCDPFLYSPFCFQSWADFKFDVKLSTRKSLPEKRSAIWGCVWLFIAEISAQFWFIHRFDIHGFIYLIWAVCAQRTVPMIQLSNWRTFQNKIEERLVYFKKFI